MKTILLAIATSSILFACNSKSGLEPKKDVSANDTSIVYKNTILTDVPSTTESTAMYNDAVYNGSHSTREAAKPRTKTSTYSRSRTTTNAVAQNTTVQRRKGWSHAAKGAAIGGVTGAITGAIISKHKGTGAIIGGILGAGTGYVIGRSKDKKEGRN